MFTRWTKTHLRVHHQLDVLFSTETFLKLDTAHDVLREASAPDFTSFHHVSELIGRRGVATQVSPVLHGEQIQFDNSIKTFECVVTALKHDEWEEPVLSINLYRPPEKTLITISNFRKEFQELLDEISINYNNIIVTGDLNIWVDCDWRTHAPEGADPPLRSLSGSGPHQKCWHVWRWSPGRPNIRSQHRVSQLEASAEK